MPSIWSKTLVAITSLVLLSSCSRLNRDIEPKVSYVVSEQYLLSLKSAFPPLSESEKRTEWGKELIIGKSFAKNLDLYRAITALKRAEFIFDGPEERKLEIQYFIVLAYYLGRRYEDVISAFNKSSLNQITKDFPAFHDLLLILYDSYEQVGDERGKENMLELLKQYYPETYDTMELSTAMKRADICEIETISNNPPPRPYLNDFLSCYEAQKKSSKAAGVLNAIIPGAGYLYVGQRQTAATALLINGLFIAAATHSFIKGNIAAGAILTSFEAGFYFGGIYGAANEAKFYNERIYEKMATPLMHKERLFPIFRLNYAF